MGKTRPKPKRQPPNYVPPASQLRPPRKKPEAAAEAAVVSTAPASPAASPAIPEGRSEPAAAGPLPSPHGTAAATGWDRVAESYDALVGNRGSEYHRRIVFPGVLKMLGLEPGQRVLDLACGQGALCRVLAEQGASVVGVDASESLIHAARARAGQNIEYLVADVRRLPAANLPGVSAGSFPLAACILAVQDIDPVEDLFLSASWALQPGGRLVLVMTHPAFRGPKATDWGWDFKRRIQYRRVDRYLLPRREKIITHPGRKDGRFTWSFHRPLEIYVKALAAAGLLIDDLEEWSSHKRSSPGSRAAAEDLARREIPLFLALRAVKLT